MATRTQHPLASLIAPATIKSLAGSAYFARGERYFREGAVRSLAEHQGTVTAAVRGTTSYKVRLWSERSSLGHSCTCPLGIDGEFCKHCVATALAWIDAKKHGGVTMLDDVEKIVMELPKDDLAQIVIDHALKDTDLRNRLLAAAARRAGGPALMPRYRKMVEDATDLDVYSDRYGYLDYGDMHDYSDGVGDMIASLNDLLKEKEQAPAVMELALYAIGRVEHAMEHGDDGAGYFNTILGDLADLHLRACRAAKPDPMELASQLFELEMEDDWGTFTDTYATYKTVLGVKGREHFRTLAEREWKKLKVIEPTNKRVHETGRYRITGIMETIARTSGGLKELVDVLRKDLSGAQRYLRIAEACREAKQYELALQWAEEGLYQFPTKTDARLLDFLAEEYTRRKMPTKMMAICWQRFIERAGLETYKALLKRAPNASGKQRWRTKALGALRAKAAEPRQQTRNAWPDAHNAAASLLVEIHLMEKHDNDAWNTAHEFGCGEALWLRLAAARATRHPEDALAVYRAQIEQRLPHASGYEETVDLLKKVRPLMQRLGRTEEFEAYIAELRVTQKRRRNFIALLEKAFGGRKRS